ncbi:MAG: hypothetical protein FJY66_03225, partial [Calditrichaeota bacterium]|nr:hypothetical protein [Calditrichota bacterium]
MNRPNSFPDRERILSILVLFAMILIVAQLVRVQLVGHDFWEKEARRQELTWKEQHPSRGDILDQMGRPLAVTLPLTFAVGYRPQECLDKEKLSKQLAAILEPANKSWQSRLKSDAKFTYLARRVSRQTAQKLRALNLACLELSEEPRRSYPCGSLAASVLGFADIDQKGQEGIELESDAVLRGSVVRQLVWIDAGTQSCVPLREISTPTAKGADIQLTLDVALQTIVEEELQKAMRTCR